MPDPANTRPRLRYLRYAALTLLVSVAAGAAITIGIRIGGRALVDNGDGPPRQAAAPRNPPVLFATLPPGYRIDNLVGGLSWPAAFDGAPDGRILVVEQFNGVVRLVTSAGLQPQPYYVIEDLYVTPDRALVDELGLVGLTFGRGEAEGYVFLYYAALQPDGRRSTRLVRIRDEGAHGDDPEVILEISSVPVCCHISGAMTWLPDATLLVGVGDHDDEAAPQDPRKLPGSVLRIKPDGTAPGDNPFVGDERGDDRVFAYGLRNPFGIAADPAGAAMYVLDNGVDGYDSIHALKPGANYGWPSNMVAPETVVERPIISYPETVGPAGAVVYRGPLAHFDGSLLWCQFNDGGALRWYNPALPRFDRDRVLLGGCSSAIRVLDDGYIYFTDYLGGNLLRISDKASF